MIGHGEKLSRKQEAAVAALISESTMGIAAHKAGIGEATLFRWMKEPRFRTAYREARRQVVDGAIGHLQTACSEAVETLREVAKDAEASAASRVSAARAILEIALKAVELQDIEERIEELEEAMSNNGKKAA